MFSKYYLLSLAANVDASNTCTLQPISADTSSCWTSMLSRNMCCWILLYFHLCELCQITICFLHSVFFSTIYWYNQYWHPTANFSDIFLAIVYHIILGRSKKFITGPFFFLSVCVCLVSCLLQAQEWNALEKITFKENAVLKKCVYIYVYLNVSWNFAY